MATTEVRCTECGLSFRKDNREINRGRKNGKLNHFCSLSCTAVSANRPRRSVAMNKLCEYCHVEFASNSRVRAARFCSHRCATLGSDTDARAAGRRDGGIKASGNLITQAEALKIREAPNYAALAALLAGRDFEFEFPLGRHVFDLFLRDCNTLVEFDGPYHRDPKQMAKDAIKQSGAESRGFRVLRLIVPPGNVPVEVFDKLPKGGAYADGALFSRLTTCSRQRSLGKLAECRHTYPCSATGGQRWRTIPTEAHGGSNPPLPTIGTKLVTDTVDTVTIYRYRSGTQVDS